MVGEALPRLLRRIEAKLNEYDKIPHNHASMSQGATRSSWSRISSASCCSRCYDQGATSGHTNARAHT